MGHHHKFGLHEAIPKPIEGGFEHLVTEWSFYHGNSSCARTPLRLGNTRAVTGILIHSTVDTETPPCWDEYVQVDATFNWNEFETISSRQSTPFFVFKMVHVDKSGC